MPWNIYLFRNGYQHSVETYARYNKAKEDFDQKRDEWENLHTDPFEYYNDKKSAITENWSVGFLEGFKVDQGIDVFRTELCKV